MTLATRSTNAVSRLTPNRLTVALLVIAYSLLLASVYESVVSPRFSYAGFVSVGPETLYVVRDALLCGALALFLPRRVSRPSDFGRILVFFLVVVPSLVIPSFLSEWFGTNINETKAYAVVAFLLLTAALIAVPSNAVRPLRLPGDTALYILLAVAAIAVLVLGSSYGFAIQIHALTDVYNQREIYSELGGGRGVIGIAAGLLQNALAPIFLSVGIYRRSPLYFAVGLLIFLYIYSITGLKSALIGLGFVVVTYSLTRLTNAETFTRVWCVVLIAFVSAAALVASIPVLSVGVDLVVRRVLVMQGMLSYQYIRIFQHEEPTYYSHTFFRTFFERPFDGNPPDIVGELLLDRSVHANGSFIADGYVSGKLLGVIFATAIVTLYLALLDRVSSELPAAIALASTCMVLFIATQSGLVTTLLNHGGLALAACLWLASSTLADRDAPIQPNTVDRTPGS